MRSRKLALALSIWITGAATSALIASDIAPPAGPVADTGPTQIFSIPMTITQPGAYVLAANVTGSPGSAGITIAASNVHLDLGGHVMTGPTPLAAEVAVSIDALAQNVVVQNGAMDGWLRGVESLGAFDFQQQVRVEDLQVRNSQNGIYVFSDGTIVRNCMVDVGVLNGIAVGDNALVEHCTTRGGGGAGIIAGRTSVIRNCTAVGNSVDGITALQGSTIETCVARENLRYGISIAGGVIRGCAAYENGVTDPPAIQGDAPIQPGSNSIETGPGGEAVVRFDAGRAATTAGLNATNGGLIVDSVARDNLGDGIQLSGNLHACSVINSTSADNGAAGIVLLGSGGQAMGCTIDDNDGEGIRIESNASTTISNCLVRQSGTDGIRVFASGFGSVTIVDSTIDLNGADGVNTAQRTSIEGTSISNNADNGVTGNADTRISTCQVTSNTLDGVTLLSRSTIVNSVVNGNGGAGVRLTGLDCLVDQNRIGGGNALGGVVLDAGSTFNQVTRNSMIANPIIDNGANNRVGTVTGTPIGAGAWDNISF